MAEKMSILPDGCLHRVASASEVSDMQIPDELVETFCNEVCSYSHIKILEPKLWKYLDPCVNCCIDHFVDWLEGLDKVVGKCHKMNS